MGEKQSSILHFLFGRLLVRDADWFAFIPTHRMGLTGRSCVKSPVL